MTDYVDVAVIGAGAAGLMAGIWAGRTAGGRSMVLLDGARKLGAKILISGGGRCNVTHDHVDGRAYAGSSRHAVDKVLRRFDVPRTVAFFRELGVELKREESGKLFPLTDRAESVLDALLAAVRSARVDILQPWRVETVERAGPAFRIVGPPGEIAARRVILATGGRSLPKSGSDGHGYAMARSLGHRLTPRIFPALVPLVVPGDHILRTLSGVSTVASVEVRSATGKRLVAFTGSILCTHFGLSGPAVLDVSRYYLDAAAGDPGAALVVNWLPAMQPERADAELLALGSVTLLAYLRDRLPERLARALCSLAGVDAAMPGHHLTRPQRKALAHILTGLPVPIAGSRGFNYAEVTAGGVPLGELHLDTMASRVCPGLHLCGEICDADGRIGGFNFQWAWASGYVAGLSAAQVDA